MEGALKIESSEPIVVGAGNSAMTSFDELEAAGVLSKDADQGETELPNAVEKEEPKTTKPLDTEEPKVKVEEGEPKSTKDQAIEAAKVAAEKKEKLFKVQGADGKEIELSWDMKVDVPVRGKKESVTLEQLKANYSGAQDWSKKYNELNTEKQVFDRDKTMLNDFVHKLDEKLNAGDAEGVLWDITKAMGGHPPTVLAKFKAKLIEQAEALSGLSPEERKAKELEEQLSLYKRQDDQDKNSRSTQREIAEIETRAQTVMKETGLDQAKMVEYYNDLKNDVKPEDLTPELIRDYHNELETSKAIKSLVAEANPEMGLEATNKAVTEMREIMEKHNFKVEDLRDIAVQVYGSSKSKTLAKKLKKSQPTQTAKVAKSDNPISFDEV